MQEQLNKVISQAMNTSSNFEQEPIEQFSEGELSDEALESVAGGNCFKGSNVTRPWCDWFSARSGYNANKLV